MDIMQAYVDHLNSKYDFELKEDFDSKISLYGVASVIATETKYLAELEQAIESDTKLGLLEAVEYGQWMREQTKIGIAYTKSLLA